MRNKLIYLILFLLAITGTSVFGQGISFENGRFKDAIEKARAEGKILFVDAYAEWCGPCKWMAANVFTDSRVGELFNREMISYKFDMEKGDGPAFASKYGVTAYPTLYFLDGDGEVVLKKVGGLGAEDLINLAREALSKAPSSNALASEEGLNSLPADDPFAPADGVDPIAPAIPEEIAPQPLPEEYGNRQPSNYYGNQGGGTRSQMAHPQLKSQLQAALSQGNLESFLSVCEQLLDTRQQADELAFIDATRAWADARGDTIMLIENIFFLLESDREMGGIVYAAGTRAYLDYVQDIKLLDFAELWAEEAVEKAPTRENQRLLATIRGKIGKE